MDKISHLFSRVRARSQAICAGLSLEDHVAQPAVFVSPPKWHLGHTTWFFETFMLKPFLKNYRVFHPDFGFIFNSYYNHEGQRVLRHKRGHLTRPTLEEVIQYRKHVDLALASWIPDLAPDLVQRLMLGIQHEEQHQELLVYDIKYILGQNPLKPCLKMDLNQPIAGHPGLCHLPEGIYRVGHDENSFAFDNERPQHRIFQERASLHTTLESKGAYLEFIEAGGYQSFQFWLDEGWTWVQENQIYAPLYWQKCDGKWFEYKMRQGLTPIQPDEPVSHISYYEADAYARFRGKRLPTEFERELLWDHLCPNQLWEWTQSAYSPYPGFRPNKGALGEYNGKFMVNQMVLKGGSVASPPNHVRPTYRNFFHPDERWMFSGIRLAEHQEPP